MEIKTSILFESPCLYPVDRVPIENYISCFSLIFIDETLNINDFQFFKTDQQYIIDKLDIHKKFVYAEFKELLGFNNVQIEKKERLITDEAEQNNEIIVNGYVKSMLDERKECCKKIKELFNVDINVKLNREEMKQDDNSIQGKLYNNAKNSNE